MNNSILNCLLCDRSLQPSFGWQELLTRTFPKTICERCEQKFERITEQKEKDTYSLYHYNEAMQDFLHRYKFMHDVALAHVFSQILNEHLKKENRLIVPIPMHAENLKIRTFSHIDELLNAANISFEHHLIKLSSEIQSKKSKLERMQTSQLFDVIDCSKINNKKILLIDDIYTTGTTIRHAKKALIDAGATDVTAFTCIHG